ncbi:cell wall metabolism sensor histidine kinase WalK [Sporolactobacillus shoreicorticis]|uniref:histidine kinase n=1 Tax=Sporolactobacillus shoreicorticis TaxID=1923877 RepID=A0ABW5RZZ3_9BACL|nr:HAMP domain-containing sensor histidine kinase [Sporolactobacillus shoreicorticis]MCO7126789.1 cell wall metabolism sensor histidine kinase WalK [Sporolactobacillus shoreicorticis]
MKNRVINCIKSLTVIIGMLASLTVLWTVFYFLIRFILHYASLHLSPLAVHLASALLGLLFFGLVISLITRHLTPKRLSYFQTIIQALKQMAKGNFEIKLDVALPGDGKNRANPFVQLVESVDYMAKELGQLEQVRQEFISNVSHEIQSPLTSIKGFARALEDKHLSDEKREHYLNIIQTEADRLSKLSDSLLKLTALENDRQPLKLEHYRADRQIRSCLLTLEPQWSSKKLTLTIKLAPASVYADHELMNQVWMNLIHNSIKFTPDHGEITVELKEKNSEVQFRLSDTGIGIKKEDFVHLFERFYKADRSRTAKRGGNGLGLSIVKKIVDLHHGEIHVTSEYGKGTTFFVTLQQRNMNESTLVN